MAAETSLTRIPLIDLEGRGPAALVDVAPERLRHVIDQGRRHYGALALILGDRLSRRWLGRSGNPYLAEIETVAARAGGPGVHLLNLSYEWTCTSGVMAGRDGGGRLLRTLDWPLDGLGRTLVVARQDGAAGPYFNVTWPGFVGVATAMAPARFAAAINQPPMTRATPWPAVDWALGRVAVWRARGLPPVHLLRRVFDSCATYAEAKAALIETALCLPALFALAGVEAGEGCVVERLEHEARVYEAPAAIANHWLALRQGGRPRGADSEARCATMERLLATGAGDDLDWVVPPILNPTTRLAAVADAASARLTVRGFEADGPATETFRL